MYRKKYDNDARVPYGFPTYTNVVPDLFLGFFSWFGVKEVKHLQEDEYRMHFKCILKR